jgi:cellulose synthase/poly-beta-1,6-N-acetylglucosamine synthase-like glycosyltransferase
MGDLVFLIMFSLASYWTTLWVRWILLLHAIMLTGVACLLTARTVVLAGRMLVDG